MSNEATLDNAFLSGVSAADMALAMRRRLLNEPAPPPPKADNYMAALFGAAMLGAAVLTGAITYTLRPATVEHETTALVRIGEEWLAVPSEMMGPIPEETRQEVGVLRLRLNWPDLRAATDKAQVHLTITPLDPGFDPAAQLGTWSRFLTATAWSNPGGLVARAFRKGNPFEGDELYLALPDGRAFAALCPLPAPAPVGAPKTIQLEEPCRATIRHGAFDIAMRFPREALADWSRLVSGVKSLVGAMKR